MHHNLTAYLGDGPADPSILQIFRRVLEVLEAIHATGGSHPPLSPQTIRLDDSDRPHIPSVNRAHEAADTIAFGSAKYSAPEAFVDNGESSSCEIADCYVLGFMFYEILIGKDSFVAQFASLENGPPSLWLKWHADKTAKARPLSELRPNLGHFARLVDGMMEKDPAKRTNSISQVLRVFSSAEALTTYKIDPFARPAAAAKVHFAALLRKKLAFAAAWLTNRLVAFRKPWMPVGVLLTVVLGISALLVHRAVPPPHPESSSKATPKPVLPLPPAPHQDAESRPPVPSKPESELQIESHLRSRALLFLDGLRPIAVLPGMLFTEKILPGPHRLRFVAHSKSFLKLPVNIGADGDVSFFERPKIRSVRYVMLACNAKSAKLYGLPDARASLPGQAYEAVPEQGRVIANDKAVSVRLSEGPNSEVHLGPLPVRSIRIVLEPDGQKLLIPVQISANVSDAAVVIDGETLPRRLAEGVTVVRLRPGEYHIKLVHADYQDSPEQDVVISGNEQRRQLRFALSPIARPSILEVSSVPAGVEILLDGTRLAVTDSSTTFKAKVNPGMHTLTLRRPNFEDSTTIRDFPNGGTVSISGQGMRPFAKIIFHVLPSSAQITCRREDDSESQDCANNQPCLLRGGAYEVTVKAGGFKTEVKRIAVEPGDNRPYEWKLEAISSALNSADFLQNGQTWTVDSSWWWSQTQPGPPL